MIVASQKGRSRTGLLSANRVRSEKLTEVQRLVEEAAVTGETQGERR